MSEATPAVKSPLREIIEPFTGLARAGRAILAINANYLIEGFVYFGMLTYLAMYFNSYVGLGDQHAGYMVGTLTSGITFSMLFFGSRVDSWGLRKTLTLALLFMLAGRVVMSLAPVMGLHGGSILSPLNAVAVGGILLIVTGFGMYQPAIYTGVRQMTTPATSGMAFAMLYAVNNLGGWLPTFMAPIREHHGILGAFNIFTVCTVIGLLLLLVMLNRRTVDKAMADAKASADEAKAESSTEPVAAEPVPTDFQGRVRHWFRNHPLADPKFAFFIFCLIPVQTLFAYNWLVIPQYVNRAFAGSWVGAKFEFATNLNPLLIFILCPVVAALTARAKVFNMMVLGTAVMAAPTFLLAFGPTVWGLFSYILIMTIGEAMWQPRFLQYAAEIAPEGRTGAYMGVAQFPWFLTKVLVPIYSGAALARWCPMPGQGAANTGFMWLVFGCVAIVSPVLLILSKGWLGKDFKTKA